ncbi:hypothetical protein [Gordonia soli]|nr:hypothetical protein [Gordonia soli]
MSSELEGLPPHIIAALRAPEGTTPDEIRAQFPELQEQTPRIDPNEYRSRVEDAYYRWQQQNSWVHLPDDVSRRLADQVRSDMEWEVRGGA